MPVYNKYCSVSCQNKHQSGDLSRHPNKKKIIEINRVCPKCNTNFSISVKEGSEHKVKKFCNRKCANSRVVNSSQKIQIRNSLLRFNKEHNPKYPEDRNCEYCNILFHVNDKKKKTRFCSRSCASKHTNSLPHVKQVLMESGRRVAEKQAETRRSKNEIYFAELCEKYFKKIYTNKPMFNGWDADVIIEDIKTAVMWNGKWHYEKITEAHSVKQVQNRDKIKIKEIKNSGYTPYVIKDMGGCDKEFVENEFNKFIAGRVLVPSKGS